MEAIAKKQFRSHRSWEEIMEDLIGFVIRRVKDKSLAEDLSQEIYLKAHARWDQLRDKEKVTAWIHQIARNTIADYFRNRKQQVGPDDLDWETPPNILNECAALCTSELLDSLPYKYRLALQLSDLGNYSQVELARALNISYSGAKSRVQRARQMLKKKLDQRYVIKTDAYGNVVVCKSKAPCNCPSLTCD